MGNQRLIASVQTQGRPPSRLALQGNFAFSMSVLTRCLRRTLICLVNKFTVGSHVSLVAPEKRTACWTCREACMTEALSWWGRDLTNRYNGVFTLGK